MQRTLTILFLLLLAPLPCLAQRAARQVPGEVIVKWRTERSRFALTRVAGRRVVRSRAVTKDTWVYRLEERTARATRDAVASLERLGDVEYVEPNYIRRPFRVPNDQYYKTHQWNIKAVNLEKAWDRTTGKSNVVVAVIDTGVLWKHPDLAGRLLPGYDFVSDKTKAGDNNGWDSDPRDEGTDSKFSSAFHGTHVTGIIAARTNNKTGMAGVDWNCKVLPVRALGINKGEGADVDIVAGIRWAAGLPVSGAPTNPNPAKIINLSFGGAGYSATLHQAVAAAQAKGVIVVAAAGNDKLNAAKIYPAAFKDVVTVGAVQKNLSRAPYSNFGSVVDIMAPGGNVSQKLAVKCDDGNQCPAGILGTLYRSAKKKFGYVFYDGTSQAAPLVAGVISLMVTINPKLNGAEVIKILKSTANPVSKCNEGCGAGLVDAAAALSATAGGGTTTPGAKLPFSSSCTNDAQCAGGLCRDLGAGKACTRTCSSTNQCPSGSTCTGGLCYTKPTAGGGGGNTNGGTVTGVGVGGCSVSGKMVGSVPVMVLLLLLVVCARRRG